MIIHKKLMIFEKFQKTIIQQKKRVLIVFDEMIVDMDSNEELRPQ